MQKKTLIAVAVAGALSIMTLPVALGAVINNRAAEIVGYNVGADPMLAVESNRSGIISRLVIEHRAALDANSINESAFRNALASLRADQLLVASLVGTLEEVSSIVAAQQTEGATLARFVAVAPTVELASMPAAEAYLVREGEQMSIVKASQLQLNANTQLVGYFVTGAGSTAITTALTTTRSGELMPKDGSGSGASSWIGYTAGGNQATGTSSAVAAGANNLASGQNSFVGAGVANQANGISSLVIGGFDNRANGTDSLVGAGAGHRATGARAVIVGGGYNLASGGFSFIGGGGRDGVVSTAAGTDAKDHIASGKWTTVGGGVGNRTSGIGATVAGGGYNSASADGSFIGGGGVYLGSAFPNTVNGVGGVIGGGFTNTTGTGQYNFIGGGYQNNTSTQNGSSVLGGFLNTASGQMASVLGGRENVASGAHSVAAGYQALTQTSDVTPVIHDNAFVFSDGSTGRFRSTDSNTFNVLATGGVRFVTGAVISSGESVATKYVDILGGTGVLSFEGGNTTKIVLDDGDTTKNIGVQPNTVYYRTNGAHAWYYFGTESATALDPGSGGSVLATLTSGASSTTVTGTFRAQAFTATSDRDAKTNFGPLDAKAILAKVARLPVSTWSYKNEAGDGIRHIGPMAQDFREIFGIGYDEKSIATIDADGVALAAIKGLVEEARERDVLIESQRAQLTAQLQRIAMLEEQQSITAAAQLQMLDMAQTLAKLQLEMAQLRRASEVALAPR